MVATGIPAEVAFLMFPVLGAIGFVWYLAWRALKSFYVQDQGVEPIDLPRRDVSFIAPDGKEAA